MSVWTSVILAIVGVAVILIAMAVSLNDEHHAGLKLFMFIVALLLCVIALNAAAEIVLFDQALAGGSAQDIVDTLYSAYKAILYLTYFTIPYFIIYFIWQLFKARHTKPS